jgi:hypothetical protein
MSIKVVVFGENDQTSKFVAKSRTNDTPHSNEAVSVENVVIAETAFLLFTVQDRNLVS